MFKVTKLKNLVLLVVLLGLAILPSAGMSQEAPPLGDKPNFLFILTDDLDEGSVSRMPKLEQQLISQGTTFEEAFSTAPQCCPARASFLTGKYPHNHTVYDNHETLGGAYKFRRSGQERDTVATRLDAQGYQTILIGKYLNWYNGSYIPPGWDNWHGQMGRNNNNHYNVNGTKRYFDPEKYHDTDLFKNWADQYLDRGAGKKRPFFMYLSVNAPHGPAIPAERHEGKFTRVQLPRPPSFNEADVSDKPRRIRALSRLTRKEQHETTKFYRDRLRSMLSVDDMIGKLLTRLRETGELDDTYIVFTSDHGYHFGQHRLPHGKTRPYEEDINIPMYVRGPGVPAGRTLDHKVLNTDFASTFTELAAVPPSPTVDGRSFAPLLGETPPPAETWRKSLLVEFYRPAVPSPQRSDAFFALRTDRYSYAEHASGERELYDLENDPYQLTSLHDSPEHQALADELHTRLEALKSCSGQASCEAAEEGAAP